MDTLLTLGLNLVSLSLTIISTVVFIQNHTVKRCHDILPPVRF